MLVLLGTSALIIGLMIFLLGPHSTASFFAVALNPFLAVEAYSGGLGHPNADNELRFYSVFWMAYGVGVIWLTANRPLEVTWIYVALGLFFLGGIGRLVSSISVGAPDPLFTSLMFIELVLPVIVAILYAMGKGKATGNQ